MEEFLGNLLLPDGKDCFDQGEEVRTTLFAHIRYRIE
jgi:hypothetical protein